MVPLQHNCSANNHGPEVIVLGVTSTTGSRQSHVPTSVFVLIMAIQGAGVLIASLLVDPSTIVRNDGRSIAVFRSLSWTQEIEALYTSLTTPRIALMTPAFFACQMPTSLTGSLNGFYFNARTRALVNVSFF